MDTIERDKTPAKPREKAKVLRAKPVEGEVDQAALSREFMARFPRLIAALAESEKRCQLKNTINPHQKI